MATHTHTGTATHITVTNATINRLYGRHCDLRWDYNGGATNCAIAPKGARILSPGQQERMERRRRDYVTPDGAVSVGERQPLAIYGGGYGFSSLRDAGWLWDCEVLYWGDLDTHGFRILDELRAVHPHVVSVLMEEATLLAHRDAWGSEPSPSRAALSRLTDEESALYEALGNDSFGTLIRLEQELIRWEWARERLSAMAVPAAFPRSP